MPINRERLRTTLHHFAFRRLFIEEMGWANPTGNRPTPMHVDGATYQRQPIAQLSGITVFEVYPTGATARAIPDERMRRAIHSEIEKIAHENLLIFLDDERNRTQSLWYWVKREQGRKLPREHTYFKGQPGDLFLSKLDGLVVEMDELRPDGTIPITDATRKLTGALDVERVTKRFYSEFSDLRELFVLHIRGIEREADRTWYASVLLNRLMFVYFLQKKGFIQNNAHYLENKLDDSQQRGPDRYYGEFLAALFFEGFAKPEDKRSSEAKDLLGPIKYLNGGLFLRHPLEEQYPAIQVPDDAFENVLGLFGRYSWHLDDTPGAADNEINPDVLGYIFEKYINQKAFGAYYTRTEITEYLCERTIHAAILDRLNALSERQFTSLGEVMLGTDSHTVRLLLNEVLPKLSVLDPACGSGAFLVAAMKTLLDIYGALFGKIEVLNDFNLNHQLQDIRREHASINYYIRKRIITDNLYGVDIMEEATEIARLRLFLALVASVEHAADLEPLPNIDFNIMPGNSLIGLLTVDEDRFSRASARRHPAEESMRQGNLIPRPEQMDFLGTLQAKRYNELLADKDRLIETYRKASGRDTDLHALRDRIDDMKREHYAALNELLLQDFQALGVKYEQAQAEGKTKKRPLASADITALTPFHWGYEFDQILGERGGFDVIITNPPWEVFQTDEKEFFQRYDKLIQKKKIDIKTWEKQRDTMLQDPEIQQAWLEYCSGYPHVSAYFKGAPQYRHQYAEINGKSVARKINLYMVFTEQCYNLLRLYIVESFGTQQSLREEILCPSIASNVKPMKPAIDVEHVAVPMSCAWSLHAGPGYAQRARRRRRRV